MIMHILEIIGRIVLGAQLALLLLVLACLAFAERRPRKISRDPFEPAEIEQSERPHVPDWPAETERERHMRETYVLRRKPSRPFPAGFVKESRRG
jgi:hypothetical protein